MEKNINAIFLICLFALCALSGQLAFDFTKHYIASWSIVIFVFFAGSYFSEACLKLLGTIIPIVSEFILGFLVGIILSGMLLLFLNIIIAKEYNYRMSFNMYCISVLICSVLCGLALPFLIRKK